MKTNRLLAGIGAIAMAAASVTAHAGTRATDASDVKVQPVKLSAVSGTVSRSAATADKRAEIGGPGLIIGLLGLAAVIGAIAVASSNSDDRSPGA